MHDWMDDQYELLKAAYVVICRAGHGTIMKTILLGKPMILIPIPDHTEQYGNAKSASKLGLAEVVPQRDVTTERLLDATRRLLNSPVDGLQRLTEQMPLTEAIAIGAREIEGLASDRRKS